MDVGKVGLPACLFDQRTLAEPPPWCLNSEFYRKRPPAQSGRQRAAQPRPTALQKEEVKLQTIHH